MNRTLAVLAAAVSLVLGAACTDPTPPRGVPVIPPTVTVTVPEFPLAPGEYARGQLFGYDYLDADRDGCDTREELLAAPGSCPPRAPAGVSIVDPYTGGTVTGRANIDVEHIVPLHWWWKRGATNRPREDRLRFANDFGSPDGVDNAILASASVNSRKGARGPSEWLPPDVSRHCWYADRWQGVLDEYEIALPPDDPDAVVLAKILRTC